MKIRENFRLFFEYYENFLNKLAKNTGIHGLKHVANRNYHWIERWTWFLLVCLATYNAILIGLKQYKRFTASPTVMSLDRNYRLWNGTLPAVTLCYNDHLDSSKADEFIQDKWNVTIIEEQYFYFLEFLYAVINATAENYIELARFAEDERFQNLDLFEVSKSIDRTFHHNAILFDTNLHIQIEQVMTERGWCYSFNSPISEILKNKNVTITELKTPVHCQYYKQQCFIKLHIFESTATLEVHSPYEISSSGTEVIQLKKSDEILASYKVTETIATDRLRELKPYQRKCVFENENTFQLPVYSKSLCLAKCRAIMALEMCNCVPFFYPFVDGPGCTPAGFECLLDFKWPVWALHMCKCPSTCTEHQFSMHTMKKSIWGQGNNDVSFQTISSFCWNIIPSRIRIKRDVLFSLEDLFVSFGGAAALFVGISFIAFCQIIYIFITILYQIILKLIKLRKISILKYFMKSLFKKTSSIIRSK